MLSVLLRLQGNKYGLCIAMKGLRNQSSGHTVLLLLQKIMIMVTSIGMIITIINVPMLTATLMPIMIITTVNKHNPDTYEYNIGDT